MSETAEIIAETNGELALFKSFTPLAVVTDKKVYGEFYEKLRKLADDHVPDLTTEKGRKEIASLAHKIARTKTAIDDAGKKLNEEARATIDAVDASRREIRTQLDELKAEVRQPLTQWEDEEKEREELAKNEIQSLRETARVDIDDTAAEVEARIERLSGLVLDENVHREAFGVAQAAKSDALAALTDAHARLVREEEERVELERLRAEAAERERVEEERLAADAEKARVAAAEKAEADRLAALQKEAAEAAQREAEAKAKAERDAAELAHASELAAERERTAQVEREAQAERERVAKAANDAKAAADKEAADLAAREADRAHRGKIMAAAKEAIMEAGPVEETVARSIVLAIAAGNVPNIQIRF